MLTGTFYFKMTSRWQKGPQILVRIGMVVPLGL